MQHGSKLGCVTPFAEGHSVLSLLSVQGSHYGYGWDDEGSFSSGTLHFRAGLGSKREAREQRVPLRDISKGL